MSGILDVRLQPSSAVPEHTAMLQCTAERKFPEHLPTGSDDPEA